MITNLLNILADIIVNRITKDIEAIQGDRSDLEALACDRKCGKRRTPSEHCKNQLFAVGLHVFKDALGESKYPSTDNQQAVDTGARPSICVVCSYEYNCPNVDMTISKCDDFLHMDDVALNEQRQAVTESNVDAAESARNQESDELTKLADSLKEGDKVPVGIPNNNPRYESTKKACEESIGIKKD